MNGLSVGRLKSRSPGTRSSSPACSSTDRSSTWSPIATPIRGRLFAGVVKTPYGRFWIGKSESFATARKDLSFGSFGCIVPRSVYRAAEVLREPLPARRVICLALRARQRVRRRVDHEPALEHECERTIDLLRDKIGLRSAHER